MKFGRLTVNALRYYTVKDTAKRRKINPPYGKHEELIDIPFINDGEYHHKIDVIYGDKPKKKCCIIDIHGGAYIACGHIDQYHFGSYFAKKGYDWVSCDYIVNDGTRSIKDMFDDLYACFLYIFSHLKELKLEDDDFVITGDSAGGHMALTMAELMCDKEYAKKVGYEFPDVKIKACLVNCPVYDFVHIGDNSLTNSGKKRMFGETYKDKKLFELFSPRHNIKSLTCPLFVSTGKKDFLRAESLKVPDDMKGRDNLFQFIDLYVDKAVHVHNVVNPLEEEGVYINDQMVDFIEKARNL